MAFWNKHSSPTGLASVCACIIAGSFYQQAPRRSTEKQEINIIDNNRKGEQADIDNDPLSDPTKTLLNENISKK